MIRNFHLTTLALVLTHAVGTAGTTLIPEQPITTTPSSEWIITSAVYVPLMGLEGDIGVAGIKPGHVDMSFSDVFEDLDAGLSGAWEAKKGRWSVMLDGIWLKLSDSMSLPGGSDVAFAQEQLSATLLAGYAVYQDDATTVNLVAGSALSHLKLDVDVPAIGPLPGRSFSGSQTWVDPFVGVRLRHHPNDKWTFFADGLYGGFGVSSDSYWQVLAGAGYRISTHTSLALAYRIIAVDYHQGGFVYDTESSGPNIGLLFQF